MISYCLDSTGSNELKLRVGCGRGEKVKEILNGKKVQEKLLGVQTCRNAENSDPYFRHLLAFEVFWLGPEKPSLRQCPDGRRCQERLSGRKEQLSRHLSSPLWPAYGLNGTSLGKGQSPHGCIFSPFLEQSCFALHWMPCSK